VVVLGLQISAACAADPASTNLLTNLRPAALKPQPDHVLFAAVQEQAPAIDGRLDEPVWQRAAVIDEWIDRSTSAPGELPVTLRMLTTADHLYLGFTQRHVGNARLKQPKGGDEYDGSVLEIFLDPYGGKHRTKVQIVANALGLRYDAWDGDRAWTGQWQSAGRVENDQWTIEIAIPYADMRGQSPRNRPLWKANFCVVTHDGIERSHSWTGGWGDPAADYGVLFFGEPGQYEQAVRPRLTTYLDRITYDVRDAAGVGLIRVDGAGPLLDDLSLAVQVAREGKVVASQAIAKLPAAATEFHFDVQSLPVGDYQFNVDLRRGGEVIASVSRAFSKADRRVLPPAVEQGRIPIQVHAQPALAGIAWPISTGVPFSAGSLTDVSRLRLLDPAGNEVPAQVMVRSTWSPGGPVQWVGLDFIPTLAATQQTYTLEYGPAVRRTDPKTPLRVTQDEREIRVDTGPLQFSVNRGAFALIGEAMAGGRAIVSPRAGAGLSLVDHEGNRYRADLDRQAQVVVEEQGPVRVTLRATGWYVREGSDGSVTSVELPTDRLCLFTVRLSAFAGSALVKASVSTTFTHDTDHVRLSELTIALPTTARQLRVGTQDSVATIPSGGYLLQHRHDRSVDQADVERSAGSGWVEAAGDQGTLRVAVRRFWQLFPKEIGLNDGLLTVHPWPAHGREPFPMTEQLQLPNIYKLRYAHQGRQMTLKFPAEYRQWLDDAYAKNPSLGTRYYTEMDHANGQGMTVHTDLLLDLGGSGAPDAEQLNRLVNDDPHALPDSAYLCGTGALGPILHADPQFAELERTNLRGWQHLSTRGQKANDFGMFIFGNWNNGFSYQTPMMAALHRVWSNAHYAMPRVAFIQYARSGDPTWMIYGRDLSNTVRDIAMVNYVSTQRTFPYHQLGAMYHCKGLAPWAGDAHVAAHPICIDHLIYDYLLFGNRRALDALNNWVTGIKRASPSGFATREGMTTMAELIEAYRLTWDSGLIELIDRFRSPILKKFADTETPSWDYHMKLVSRDWAFAGDPALVQCMRDAVAASPEGNSPSGLQHHDAFLALMDNDPARLERWTTRLYRDSVSVLDSPGQFGDGMTEITWYWFAYAMHKQPHTLLALKHFDMKLQEPRTTSPAPVLISDKRTVLVAQEAADEAFTVTVKCRRAPESGLDVVVRREDGTTVATASAPPTKTLAEYKPITLTVPADGKAAQYAIVIQRHALYDEVLWPVTSLAREVAVAPAGQAAELSASLSGLVLYFQPPAAGASLTLSSSEKAASVAIFRDSAGQALARASSSRYMQPSQQVKLPGGGTTPVSVYVTGLMTLRGDATQPAVFALKPEALFNVNPALLAP
jgi:hypothetical protein